MWTSYYARRYCTILPGQQSRWDFPAQKVCITCYEHYTVTKPALTKGTLASLQLGMHLSLYVFDMSLECVINLLLKQSHQPFNRQDANQIWQIRYEKQLKLLSVEVCYLKIYCLHVTHYWLVQIPQMLCTGLSMLLAKVTEVHTNLSTQQWAHLLYHHQMSLEMSMHLGILDQVLWVDLLSLHQHSILTYLQCQIF